MMKSETMEDQMKNDAMPYCPKCGALKPYCEHFAAQPEGDAAPSASDRREDEVAAPASSPRND